MLPYVVVRPLELGPVTFQPFGLLVATGVVLAWTLCARRASSLGFVDTDMQSFLWWIAIGGFVGAHLFEVALYRPQEVLERPWLLLYLWLGMSSFGGFFGATVGGFAWKYLKLEPLRNTGPLSLISRPVRRPTPMVLLPYADLMLAAFPVVWVFGRLGCTILHDHPGIEASPSSPFAVAYGPGEIADYGWMQLIFGNAPRYDLGLLELLITLPILFAFVLTWKRGGARGYYVASLCLLYPPIRFFLDFLRTSALEGGDLRYATLTPAQWSCLPILAYGVWLLRQIRRTVDAPGHVETN